MPAYNLGPAFMLPPGADPTAYAAGTRLEVGDFGAVTGDVRAFTDGVDPQGNPYWTPGPNDPDYGDWLEKPEWGYDQVDKGSTMVVDGHSWVVSDIWCAAGQVETVDGPTWGGVHWFELSDGTDTRWLAMPNSVYLQPDGDDYRGLTDPADLKAVTIYDAPMNTGTLWPNYGWSNFGTPICFAAGTLIRTPDGERAVESIRPGDLVLTLDHGARAVRWAGRCPVPAARLRREPNLRPIRVRAGALGPGMPARDLVVSPQHRLAVGSRISRRMFGEPLVLVAAVHLAGLPGIGRAEDMAAVDYHHILLDRHEVVWAEGAPAETLFLGPQAIEALSPEGRAEVAALFPGLVPEPARAFVPGRRARRLVERHAQARHPLVEGVL